MSTYSSAPHFTKATTGTRFTKTRVDGLGRTKKVESGYVQGGVDTVVSIVETQYAPCACTPVGKLWKTSLPYAPGGTPKWTEHLYDAIGRTVTVRPTLGGASVLEYARDNRFTRWTGPGEAVGDYRYLPD